MNGVKTEFIVVHQGKPSDMYDDSCSGAWLLMKDVYENRQWNSTTLNNYEVSSIHSYLNGAFFDMFDSNVKDAIKQVKVPYVNGVGTTNTVASGANGLSTKIFLLSGYEVGWTTGNSEYFPEDGTNLSYFSGLSKTDAKRIGYLDGEATGWWLRSAYTYNTSGVWRTTPLGSNTSDHATTVFGVRPAFILPFDTIVSGDGTIQT